MGSVAVSVGRCRAEKRRREDDAEEQAAHGLHVEARRPAALPPVRVILWGPSGEAWVRLASPFRFLRSRGGLSAAVAGWPHRPRSARPRAPLVGRTTIGRT